jgi:hypothetical protein
VNTIMNFRVLYDFGKFLSSYTVVGGKARGNEATRKTKT